jgi:hypothetical protein
VSNKQGTLSREAFQQEVRKELDSFRTQVVDGLAKLSEAFKDASPDMLANAAALLKNQPVTASPSPAAGSTKTKPPTEQKNWLARLWQWTKEKCKAGWENVKGAYRRVKQACEEHPWATAFACATVFGFAELYLFGYFGWWISVGIVTTVVSAVAAGIVLDPTPTEEERKKAEQDVRLYGPPLLYVASRAVMQGLFGMAPWAVLTLGLLATAVVIITKAAMEAQPDSGISPASAPAAV